MNFGEERYDKGYYLVTVEGGRYSHEFRPTTPRPMLSAVIDLDGAEHAEGALERFRAQVLEKVGTQADERRPLLELKLIGRVAFHPFELGRERLRLTLIDLCHPLHVEIKNHLSLVTRGGGVESEKKSLAVIEREVLHELVSAKSEYKGREEELVRLSLAIRDMVIKGDVDGDELLSLLREA